MNYITQVVETIRVPNVNEVEKLHKELKDDNRFELKKFEYSHKEVKQKGEVIDEYELVKATLVFNNEKEPISSVEIEFDVENGFFPEPINKQEEE
jgi:hypothetical protein